MHKAGFVNIVGNPNVGKSTLMNALVGERISIATFKAQTTRHRIMGIYRRKPRAIASWAFIIRMTCRLSSRTHRAC